MKPVYLLATAALCVFIYSQIKKHEAERRAPETITATPVAIVPPRPSKRDRSSFRPEEFEVVRGTIRQVRPEGLVISLAPPVGWGYHGDPMSSGERAAAAFIEADKKEYGPMLATTAPGRIESVQYGSSIKAQGGDVVVCDYPTSSKYYDGMKVRFLAASLEEPVRIGGSTLRAYTMDYELPSVDGVPRRTGPLPTPYAAALPTPAPKLSPAEQQSEILRRYGASK